MEDEEVLREIKGQIASVQDSLQQMAAFKEDSLKQVEEIRNGLRPMSETRQISLKLSRYKESLNRAV